MVECPLPHRSLVLTGALHAARLLALLLVLAVALPLPAFAEDGLHVVRAGERMADIALAYDVDVYELAALNDIDNPNLIAPGQHLLIPGTRLGNPYGARALSDDLPGDEGYYIIQPGDSLSVVAIAHSMSLTDLMRLNGLEDASMIWVGQKLRITARAKPLVYEIATPESALQPADAIYVVQSGDSLSAIARQFGANVEELLVANGLPNVNMLFPGQRLRVPSNRAVRDARTLVAGAPVDGERRIEVDLSDQTLEAWQGDVRIFQTTVSTGQWPTPTVIGEFAVDEKYSSQDMYGDDYYLPGVPWVMYFHGAYAIHGAYWHANFGTPSSHGCVNMRIDEAAFLFDWAAPGTAVVVHD